MCSISSARFGTWQEDAERTFEEKEQRQGFAAWADFKSASASRCDLVVQVVHCKPFITRFHQELLSVLSALRHVAEEYIECLDMHIQYTTLSGLRTAQRAYHVAFKSTDSFEVRPFFVKVEEKDLYLHMTVGIALKWSSSKAQETDFSSDFRVQIGRESSAFPSSDLRA